MTDNAMNSAGAYQDSSCPGPLDAEGAVLPEPLWDDPDYRRREREWNRTAGTGWPQPKSLPEQPEMGVCAEDDRLVRRADLETVTFSEQEMDAAYAGLVARATASLPDSPPPGMSPEDRAAHRKLPQPAQTIGQLLTEISALAFQVASRIPQAEVEQRLSDVLRRVSGQPPLMLADGSVNLGLCSYYARCYGLRGCHPRAICSFACHDEPRCITQEPAGGWPGLPEARHG